MVRGFLAIQARSQDDSISLPLDAKPAGCGVRRLSTAEDEAPESPVRVRERALSCVGHESSRRWIGHAGTGPPVSRWSVVRRCMEQARIIHAPLWGFSDEFTEFEAAQPRRQ